MILMFPQNPQNFECLLGRLDRNRPEKGMTFDPETEWDPTCYHGFRKGLLWLQVSKRSSCRENNDLSTRTWTWRPEDLKIWTRLSPGWLLVHRIDVDVEQVEWLRKQPLLVQRKETLWGGQNQNQNQSFSFYTESCGSSQADRNMTMILEGSGSTGTGSGPGSGLLVPNMFWKHPELIQNNNPEPSLDPEVSSDSSMSSRPRPAERSWNKPEELKQLKYWGP